MENHNESRRKFFKVGAAGAGILALGATGVSASTDVKDVKYDEEYDVVVIGSGYAGNSAAVTAAERGLKVLIVEKMGRIGGNSVINGGAMSVPGGDLQKKQGIKDSVEQFMADCSKAGMGLNHPDILRVVGERAQDAFNLAAKCGAKWSDKIIKQGGHSAKRSILSVNSVGADIIRPMNAYFKKLSNATVKTRTKFDNFIMDGERVVGVVVREKYKFNKKLIDDDAENKGGKVKNIRAKHGVIMASGGFANDKYFRQVQNPNIPYDADTTNQPGATAGALASALDIGAIPSLIDWLQFGPWCSPDEKGFGVAPNFVFRAGFINGIVLDPVSGKRFTSERGNRRVFTDALMKHTDIKKDLFPVAICGADGVKGMKDHIRTKPVELGVVKMFDTLDALAKQYALPVDALKETVKKYNGYVKAGGADPEFGKETNGIDISKAPYYAVRVTPKLHHCMGGVKITPKAEVVSIKTKKPIPGLYAAGEAAGGTHGATRLGSLGTADGLVFGMVAGENV